MSLGTVEREVLIQHALFHSFLAVLCTFFSLAGHPTFSVLLSEKYCFFRRYNTNVSHLFGESVFTYFA